MILPFIMPQDHEVLNLSQMVRFKQTRPPHVENGQVIGGDFGEVEIYLTDGTKRIYTGEAAGIVNDAIFFQLKSFGEFRRGMNALDTEKSSIITKIGDMFPGRN